MYISLFQQLEQQVNETLALRFSANGKRLAISNASGSYLWQCNEQGKWEYVQSFPGMGVLPRSAPDGKMFGIHDQEHRVQIVSLDDEAIVATLPDGTEIPGCDISPDQRWLVSGDTRRNIVFWDLHTSQQFSLPVPSLPFNPYSWDKDRDLWQETIRHVKFTPDGKRLVFNASNREGKIQICLINPLQKRVTLQKILPHGESDDIAIAPDGKTLAIVDNEGVSVYDLDSFQRLHTFPQTQTLRYGLLAFSPESQFLASSKSDGCVDIWSLATGEQVACLEAHPGLMTDWSDPIGGLAWSSTGYIATGGASAFEADMQKYDYTIKIWQVEL